MTNQVICIGYFSFIIYLSILLNNFKLGGEKEVEKVYLITINDQNLMIAITIEVSCSGNLLTSPTQKTLYLLFSFVNIVSV